MKQYKFLRNYGKYKKNMTYPRIEVEAREEKILIGNGTIVFLEVPEDEIAAADNQEINITQTYLKDNHKEIYDALIEKGKKSRDKEVEKLEAELAKLKASLDAFEGD